MSERLILVPMPVYRGVFHVHSTFSDGQLTVDQLRKRAENKHLDFLVICEHAKHILPDRISLEIEQIVRYSDDKFLLLLGIEFEDEGRHVIVVAPPIIMREISNCRMPDNDILRAMETFVIWAHPALSFTFTLKNSSNLPYDAWEVWNYHVDGKMPSFPILMSLKKTKMDTKAIGGSDAHTLKDPLLPIIEIEANRLTVEDIIGALHRGTYKITNCTRDFYIASNGDSPGKHTKFLFFSIIRYFKNRIRCQGALFFWHFCKRFFLQK